MIASIKTYWEQLNERDRLMLLIGGVVVGIYLLYAAIFSPLNNAVEQAKMQLSEQQSTLTWMQQVHQQYKKTNTPQTLSNGQFLTILGDQLSKTSFHQYKYQLEQTGKGDIQLSFETVPYNQFITWLWKLGEHYNFSIQQLNVTPTDTAGVVKAMVILSAGG